MPDLQVAREAAERTHRGSQMNDREQRGLIIAATSKLTKKGSGGEVNMLWT